MAGHDSGMRITPNLFSIAFGLCGLGNAWRAAELVLPVPSAVASVILIVAAAAWCVLVAAYLAQGARRVIADLHDPVQSPYVSLVPITAMALGAALSAVAFSAGRVLTLVFLAVTLAFGAWLFGEWAIGEVPVACCHPGYFLPTVAGGLLAAYAAAVVHLPGLAQVCLGFGIVSWLVLGSLMWYRLFFHAMLPAPLVPTLAIEVAPPALAGFAWFAMNGGRVDLLARVFGGYAVLMVVVQVRFLPLYARLRFSPGFWAFTFSYAVIAVDALTWLAVSRPSDTTAYASITLGLITVLVGGIAIRTVIALARRQFLPPDPPVATPQQVASG